MYARTQEIIRLFKLSWQQVKERFEELLFKFDFEPKYVQPYIDFINEIIATRQDEHFRAGTTVHNLMISRSVNHGLRMDQKYIKLEIFDHGFDAVFRDGEKEYRSYKIENLKDPRFLNLLKTLESIVVD
jgi:hypothetical protein